jgi:hypothetical protein
MELHHREQVVTDLLLLAVRTVCAELQRRVDERIVVGASAIL